MSAFFEEFKLYIIGVAALIVLGGVAWFSHARYESGKAAGEAAKVAYYEPLLKTAGDAKVIADERARKAETDAQTVTNEANHNAKTAVDSVVAERDLALASVRDAENRARSSRQQLPANPGAACKPDDPAASAARDRDDAEQIKSSARGQSDAEQVVGLQQYLVKLRAAMAVSSASTK